MIVQGAMCNRIDNLFLGFVVVEMDSLRSLSLSHSSSKLKNLFTASNAASSAKLVTKTLISALLAILPISEF